MRYKEFNQKKVLETCISLFWENSFKGTSINTIVHNTRVNRFSLYHEFDNKQGILYEALKLYKERYSNKLLKRLETNINVEVVLKGFFNSYLKKGTNPSGCFVINTATELGDEDEKVKSFLKSYLESIESRFISLLNSNSLFKEQSKTIASNLVLLFCNVMCYCHILNEKESREFIELNLDIILNK
jgi:TetR/AcrR family transcriptional repressor of nem operon